MVFGHTKIPSTTGIRDSFFSTLRNRKWVTICEVTRTSSFLWTPWRGVSCPGPNFPNAWEYFSLQNLYWFHWVKVRICFRPNDAWSQIGRGSFKCIVYGVYFIWSEHNKFCSIFMASQSWVTVISFWQSYYCCLQNSWHWRASRWKCCT